MTGGLLWEVQIYIEMYVYVPTKVVLYDRWSLITVVLKHRFHSTIPSTDHLKNNKHLSH